MSMDKLKLLLMQHLNPEDYKEAERLINQLMVEASERGEAIAQEYMENLKKHLC